MSFRIFDIYRSVILCPMQQLRTSGMRTLYSVSAFVLASALFGQARLVLNNNAFVRIDGGAWVVLEEPTPVALQTLGTGGNIVSEDEFNRIRWQIRNTLGTYVIPFTTANGVKMPFTYQPALAGSNEATASVAFSTYNYGAVNATNWNNDLYRPSDVTHMNNFTTALPNSDHVVDRFWIVDPGVSGFAYGTRPGISLGFTYDPGAGTGEVRTGNAITGATTVGAQRFNAGTQQWGDYLPQGTFSAGAVNAVTGVLASAADFHRSWTLSDIGSPLPVELSRLNAECGIGQVRVDWSTASERQNAYFVIEHSSDGQLFGPIGTVAGAGTSSTSSVYQFVDHGRGGVNYYRLVQVDLDGRSTYSMTVVAQCEEGGSLAFEQAYDQGSTIQAVIRVPNDQVRTLALYDAGGKLIWEQARIPMTTGSNRITIPGDHAPGIYLLRSSGPEGDLFRKVFAN